jgi:hypothetical protein
LELFDVKTPAGSVCGGAPQISARGVILITVKRWLLAVVLLGGATATVVPWVRHDGARSVRLLGARTCVPSARFDAPQSAGLFVGVRDFASVAQVPFAVDDAIDLAYAFSMERRVRLVPPSRVVLVLSSPYPVKSKSRDRLRALREAGADIRYRADAADIAAALREQAALAGRDGMLIVSIAAHGLLREGNSYVLGRSSLVRVTGSMLATNDIFETIATSPAQRSLVFLDACRERMTTGTRSVLASALTAAPLLERRVGRASGQAVFYAAAPGQWAYDDPVAQNGVFTEAVIDGMLNCSASISRNVVTVDTLSRHVARYVKEWIQKNRDPNVVSATQASIDGDARDMPLARCGVPPVGPERAIANGSVVCAISGDRPLWRYEAGSAVTRADVIDLDADGWREVVFGTRDAIAALDDQGKLLWTAHEPMALTAFVTGPLSRKPMKNVVALWSGEHASRLAVYAPDGKRGATFDSARLDRITIARATNRHTPKLIATSGNTLMAFDAKSLAAGKSLWSGRITPQRDHIASLDVIDGDGDGKSDIAVTTASGAKVFVDVYGHAVRTTSGVGFVRITRGARSRR